MECKNSIRIYFLYGVQFMAIGAGMSAPGLFYEFFGLTYLQGMLWSFGLMLSFFYSFAMVNLPAAIIMDLHHLSGRIAVYPFMHTHEFPGFFPATKHHFESKKRWARK